MAYVIRAKLCGAVSTFAAESDAAALRAIHELRAEHASVVVIDTTTSEQVGEFDIENRIDGVGAAFAPTPAPVDAHRP